MRMRVGVLFLALACSAASASGEGAKPCEELKAEIAKKLEAKGVKGYSLEIVAKGEDAEGKVVGSCDGGTKKIVYRRAAAPSAPATPEAGKP